MGRLPAIIPAARWGLLLAIFLGVALSGVASAKDEPRLDAELLSSLSFRALGPGFMSGRISDLVVDPSDPSTWYLAVGSGGVWKTTNAGATFEPLFDGESSYSIGCITLDPSNPAILWVGSGENVSGRHVGFGDGIYRSLDGGKSWKNLGLKESEHIGMIRVDPRDSQRIWVAAQGPLWSGGGERGLYLSEDGGESWSLKLAGANAWTGANEVHLDPRDPDTIYAIMHQRLRDVAALVDGGPGSGIFKSVDAGESWDELKSGLPEESKGKIGFAISPQRPDVVYATIELGRRTGGFWRSEDGGQSWEKRSDYLSGGTGPHYYMELFADPHRFDVIYQADVWMHRSEDGGSNFSAVPSEHKHSDAHALAFHPTDADWLLSGVDGGLYESFDRGDTWKYFPNLPITQYYKVAVDYDEPFYHVVGGTQDNATQYGPVRTDNVHGIRNEDWSITVFGDGHQPAIDPTNPDIIYSEWQQGNLVRVDRPTGEVNYIQPQPAEGEASERFNWDSPILISPHDPATLYFASQRMWRSRDRGDSWEAVSADLSRQEERHERPMMGRVQEFEAAWDVYAMSKYGTISSIAESPLVEGLLYAGTDDGRLHLSENGGASWREAGKLKGAGSHFFVNDIKADRHDPDTVWVAVDNHKLGDFAPYLYRSKNRGKSFERVSGDLPERHLVWRVVQDAEVAGLLFAATEFGVFTTFNGGKNWHKLSGGMPTISIRDLAIQEREVDLVAASFGRGFFVLDDYSALRQISEAALDGEAMLFPTRDAWWYQPRRPMGFGAKGYQGHTYYSAENPPFGAVLRYYLRDDHLAPRETRQKADQEKAKDSKDAPWPGWEGLEAEERAISPAALLILRNESGKIIRQLEGPATAGIHALTWDLAAAGNSPFRADGPGGGFFEEEGPRVAPGRYTVELAVRTGEGVRPLATAKSFEVKALRERGLKGATPADHAAWIARLDEFGGHLEAADLQLDGAIERATAIQAVLARSGLEPGELDRRAGALLASLRDLKLRLRGNEVRGYANDPGPVSIEQRLWVATFASALSTYGPTPTGKDSYEIAERQFRLWRGELGSLLEGELSALEARLDEANAPWTPGRSLSP